MEASQAPLKVPWPQTRVRQTVSSAGHVPREAKHARLRPRQMLMPSQEQTLVTARQKEAHKAPAAAPPTLGEGHPPGNSVPGPGS